MRNLFHFQRYWGVGAALLGVLLLPATGQAKILVLYATQPGVTLDAMREAAASLNTSLDNGPTVRESGIGFKVSEGNLLSADLSPGASKLTYIWSDGPIVIGSGFRSSPGTVFDNPAAQARQAQKGKVKPSLATSLPTVFADAHIRGKSLMVSYSLATAGPVQIQAYGLKGQLLGRWRLDDGGTGRFEKTLSLQTVVPQNSPVFVRWSQNGINFTKRVGQLRPK